MPYYYRANRISQRQPRTDPLEIPSPTLDSTVLNIALERLTLSPASRRKINDQTIQTLAARIQAGAQIRRLIVVPGENDQYYVVAGERRLAAIQLLLKQGRIGAGYLVACRVINAAPAPDSAPVLAEEPNLSYSVDHERRRRFLDLRNRCPGLITGSELAIRELSA
jgi:hypothetical protein